MKKRVQSGAACDTIVPLLLAVRKKKPKSKPVIAAVAGGSGDGKGWLIDRLTERLAASKGVPPDGVAVLALDDYYVGAKKMREAGIPHFDHPDAVDLALAAEHLRAAVVAKSQKIPKYDFASGERAGEQDFTAKAFILVDGLFALRHPEILALADLRIFVRSDHDSSMLRRLFRDAGPDGRTRQSSRQVLQQYFATVWPAKKEFIDPTAARADVIVESCYDPAAEAHRAGPLQVQLKARGYRSDDDLAARFKATRIAALGQTDRFMLPKAREHRGELLRLRIEQGEVLLTYKGPFLPDVPGGRHATSPISLPMGAMRWFIDDYDACATFQKSRTLFQAEGLTIARDRVDGLGSFIEVRSTSAADLPKMQALLARLCPNEPIVAQSYFELWKERGPSRLSP